MVWGGITERYMILLEAVAGNLTRISYRDAIVQRCVILYIHVQANNVTSQQDNPRLHVVRVLRDYVTQQNIDVLPWPAVSLDLLPIKHV
jgi:hypothetical protein